MANPTPFIGRRKELAELQDWLAGARSGVGAVALVGGELGIGKTRLVDELISTSSRDAIVGRGRWHESGPTSAYVGFREALSALCQQGDVRARLLAREGRWQELSWLGPEFAEALGTDALEPSVESGDDQYLLWRAIALLLQAAGSVCPTLLSLDDVQWADQGSLGLLGFLGREVHDLPILIVATYREEDVAANHPLQNVVADLSRAEVLHSLRLDGLSRFEVAELAISVSNAGLAPEVIHILHKETRGNPLFVTELVRELSRESPLEHDPATAVELMVPDGLRQVIARRLMGMSAECTRLLAQASVLGGEFELSIMETMCELPRDELLQAIDEALAAHAIDEVGRTRFALHHPLIRSVALEGLSPLERASSHAKAALAYEAYYGSNALRHAREIVQHFIAAGSMASTEKVIGYCLAGARQARASFAFDEAYQLLHAGLEAIERVDANTKQVRAQMLTELGYAETGLGRPDGALRSYREALAIYAELGDLDGVIDTQRWLAATLARYGRWADVLDVTDEALRAAPEASSYPYVGLLGSHSMALIISARSSEAEPWVNKLLRLAFDDSTRAVANHVAACWHSWGSGEPAETVPRFMRAKELFMRAGADGTEAGIALDLAVAAHFLGQPEHMDYAMVEAERLATTTGRIATLVDLHAFRSMLCVQRGQWDEAARERDLWRSLLQELGGRTVYGQLGELGEALQAFWQFGPERALPLLKTEFPVRPEPLRALLAIERGDIQTAQALLELFQSLLPTDGRGLVWLSIGIAVVSGLASLEDARSALWAEALSRHRGGGFVWSLTDIELARIHAVAGNWSVAERMFEDAEQTTRERGMLPFHGIVLYERALMLNKRRGPGDRSRAVTLLTEAADIFDQLGLGYMRAKIGYLLDVRGPGRPISSGPCGITPRETSVLELLARGESTRQIAQQLVVSEKTVSRHLESIYGKLGVSNRVAAVAKAMKDGIVQPELGR